MSEFTFYICRHCGNIVVKFHDSGAPVVCCGEKMQKLEPNTTEAAVEKHVPVVAIDGGVAKVTVGSVAHPMTEEHHIEFICLVGQKTIQTAWLAAGDAPEATFALGADKPVAAYAFCNLHGLWKADI